MSGVIVQENLQENLQGSLQDNLEGAQHGDLIAMGYNGYVTTQSNAKGIPFFLCSFPIKEEHCNDFHWYRKDDGGRRSQKRGVWMKRLGRLVMPIVLCLGAASKARELSNFSQLPKEVRDLAIEVRNQCKELEPEMKLNYEMSGIQIFDLNGDGARDIFVDNEELCGGLRLAGGNCSNRGCDMTIYKEISKGRWRKILNEHLHAKFLAIDGETGRFQLMVASIYAGDPKCQPRKEYTSGHSCNLILTFRNNQWNCERKPRISSAFLINLTGRPITRQLAG
jgi:hypothetical protein